MNLYERIGNVFDRRDGKKNYEFWPIIISSSSSSILFQLSIYKFKRNSDSIVSKELILTSPILIVKDFFMHRRCPSLSLSALQDFNTFLYINKHSWQHAYELDISFRLSLVVTFSATGINYSHARVECLLSIVDSKSCRKLVSSSGPFC